MENESKEKQNNSSKENSSNKQNKSEDSVLKILQPQDMSKTVESALHVLQGNHEKLPDLLQDVGNIIVRASRKLSTTQLILMAGALTIGAVLLARYNMEDEYEYASE
ncbi:hypothetical protein H7F15_05435 [Pontibacter sp. Tf4]|uniref:hypothetical protein n=1 Tax=Pontibacter sp. Tf4 TaxID=2761620 RepID=UPI001623A3C3|nr:hypothetical protein [Pontibacter sp. Tf4]MBB6610470.1 hypothetical protein [Pontibacter sp. Tf4]